MGTCNCASIGPTRRGPLESCDIARSTLQITVSPGVTLGAAAGPCDQLLGKGLRRGFRGAQFFRVRKGATT